MFWFRTPSPSETQKNAFSRLCGVFNPSRKWEFPRRPCFPSVALTGRLNDTRRMTGNYLTIKREPRTIDPRKCDATKGRRTFAKRPGMIDDSLWLYLALVHNKHFSEKSRGRCVWLGSAPPPWRVLYIIHEHRIKQTTPVLLWPFTNMKSQIKPSTNHGSMFQLLPISSSQNAGAWRSWQPFSTASRPGRSAVDLFTVTTDGSICKTCDESVTPTKDRNKLAAWGKEGADIVWEKKVFWH